jgi:hypothetical protein
MEYDYDTDYRDTGNVSSPNIIPPDTLSGTIRPGKIPDTLSGTIRPGKIPDTLSGTIRPGKKPDTLPDTLSGTIRAGKKPDTLPDTLSKPTNYDYSLSVSVGEKCTIELAKKKNVFDNTNYIINLSDDELENLNTYSLYNSSGTKYNICHEKNNIAYENCAFATNNPYLHINNDILTNKNICSIPDDITLPNNNRYKMTYYTDEHNREIKTPKIVLGTSNIIIQTLDKKYRTSNIVIGTSNILLNILENISGTSNLTIQTSNIIIETTKETLITSNILRPITEIYFKYDKNSLCQERWHDWFCIPNYHLNNRWLNDKPIEYKTTKSIGKCLMPCKFGYIPTDENNGKCILKNQYNGGAYANDFDYAPIALVCLLGTTYESFLNENQGGFVHYLTNIKENIKSDESIELLKNKDEDVIDSALRNIRDSNSIIWKSVKDDIHTYINELFKNIVNIDDEFIDLNITVPSNAMYDFMAKYITENMILYAYGIAKNINDLITMDIDRYKEWRNKLKMMSNLSDKKFEVLMKVLKRACNICFNNESKFSTNFLLFTINKDKEGTYPPIKIDEKYDPYDANVVVNRLSILKKKKQGYFDEYIGDFQSYENATYTLLYLIVVILILFIIYILYIVFYNPVNMVLNSIITFIIFIYFDIKYYIDYYIISGENADPRGVEKIEFVRDFYQYFADFDRKYFDIPKN